MICFVYEFENANGSNNLLVWKGVGSVNKLPFQLRIGGGLNVSLSCFG